MPFFKAISVAVICSSNMNRSMEAHAYLSKEGFNVKSFGTGDKVKLPGNAPDRPNIYDFDTTYEEIYNDLLNKDKQYYTQNGLLHMLDRNRRIKLKPERFQESKDKFDILITCEERVYDQVIESMESKVQKDNRPAHLINIDIQDNHEEATVGSFLICELVTVLSKSDDLDNDIDELLHEFESKLDKSMLHTVLFY
ncbi:RNA polymerase II subunit A C-terminal domain phosphatase SSU72 [Copidosoma floridanum]|uniref:RNA polymerase II subunit A C-terminal domain phosphatase SSU72 n=1 Tax=Copidosoma floridanum TaxID=29053 RepID=UPI0006C9DADA|nr:RNA polymerase II subunit A C-terminal domain phosphatase SSU72 [Copidosoma floridanum]XP_014211709.1 RNA polymerase II subunit A C-terminal domain phosphatase SSU72 [Copidosoma floridanum]